MGTRWGRIAVLTAGLSVLSFAACGDSEDDPGATTEPPRAETTPRPTGLRLLAAERTVRTYYDGIDNGRFATAWRYLAREPRVQFEGYSNWKAGHEATVESDLQTATASRTGPNSGTVRVRLNTVDLNACREEVPQTFAGTWTVELVGGIALMTDAEIEKISGDDPSAPCDGSTTTIDLPPPPPPPPPPGCDSNYEGACLDPNSSDYDCSSGTGDGPDYVDGPITVVGSDPHGLDRDGNGIACEE